MSMNVTNRPTHAPVQDQKPAALPEQAPLTEQAAVGQGVGSHEATQAQVATGVSALARVDGLDQGSSNITSAPPVVVAEPTLPADLARVAASLETLIANVGVKPADVQMAAAFEATLTDLQRATSTAGLSPELVASALLTAGDDANAARQQLVEVFAGGDKKVAAQVLQSLPEGAANAVTALVDSLRPQLVAQLPGTVLRALKDGKPLSEVGKKEVRKWAGETMGRSEELGANVLSRFALPVSGVEARGEQRARSDAAIGPSGGSGPAPASDSPTPLTVPQQMAAALADFPITIPGPALVKLESTLQSGLANPALANVDIDSLMFLVMMECEKDATVDLREMVAEIKANNAKKAAVRDHLSALKKQQASMTEALRHDYDSRVASSDPTQHIDPALVSFDAYCQSQKLQVLSGSIGAVDANGMPAALANLGISPNQTWYPAKVEPVFDRYGNTIPTALVREAERLKCSPSELAEVKRVYDGDASLRTKFGSFEAMLVAATADGGLALQVPATASQSAAVNAFVATWKATNPDAKLDTTKQVTLSAFEQIGEDFLLSPAALAAAKEVFDKMNPGKSDADFRSWLAKPSPQGPGLATGLETNVASLSAFFKVIAKGPDPVADQPFSKLSDFSSLPAGPYDEPASGGPSKDKWLAREGELRAEAAAVFGASAAPKVNDLNDAISAYVTAVFALAWASKDGSFSEAGKQQARDNLAAAKRTLDEKIDALAPKKDDASNYVSAMVGLASHVYNAALVNNGQNQDKRDRHFGDFFASSVMGTHMIAGWAGRKCVIAVPTDNKGATWNKPLDAGFAPLWLDKSVMDNLTSDRPWTPQDPKLQEAYNASALLSEVAAKYKDVTFAPREKKKDDSKGPEAPATANLSDDAKARLTALTKPADPAPQAPVTRGLTEVSLAELGANIETWTGKKDTLADLSSEMSLKLQMYQERRSKFLETLSTLLKKNADTGSSIRQNIK